MSYSDRYNSHVKIRFVKFAHPIIFVFDKLVTMLYFLLSVIEVL